MRIWSLFAIALLASCAAPPRDPRIDSVLEYRAARESGDHELARAMLTDDPRVWFDSREGPGKPLNLEGKGPWGEWDKHFRSTGTDLFWESGPDFVAVTRSENNDYYRLIESGPSQYRITYFFDGDGLMAGYMVSAWDDAPPNPDRADEFVAWAHATHPDEWAYLRPDGRIDPTGDRPQRTRALANEWRRSIGLPAID